jgi:polar amino acid transport system substrate-binding protein
MATSSRTNSETPEHLFPIPARFCANLIALSLFLAFFCLFTATAQAGSGKDAAIIVGGGWDSPPYEFIDKEGNPAGYNVELTRAIAEVMGLPIEFHTGRWSETREGLQNGSIDLLGGMFYTSERARTVDFSTPHTNVTHTVFARGGTPMLTSLEGLRGKEVIVYRGSLMHDFLSRHAIARKLILADSAADALRLLASGKHDYAALGLLPGIYYVRELKLTNIVPVAKDLVSYPYCFAVKKGNTELLDKFNEGLAILKKTGKYDLIHNKWLGVSEPPSTSWFVVVKYAALVVVPLSLVLIGAVLWSYSLRNQVAQRTESLSNALSELRSNQQQLVQADKMAALGILVSGVAHEINNPTGIILMNLPTLRKILHDAERILDRNLEENGEYSLGGIPYGRVRQELPLILEEMQDGAQRIKQIVHDLKGFARRDDEAAKELLDFNTVVQTAVRLVEVTTRKVTNHFSTDYAENLPRIAGNAQRIEQVIVNLIMNSCQALPDAGCAIALSTSFDPQAKAVVLWVKDQGTGIAAGDLPHLTDPFFTTKRESGGTGLGLSISATIVKDHGGELSFASTPGAGTAVKIAFPVAPEVTV